MLFYEKYIFKRQIKAVLGKIQGNLRQIQAVLRQIQAV